METIELRIGNWVSVYNFADVLPYQKKRITGILNDGTFYVSDGSGLNWALKEDELEYIKINPIPLTEEIIQKAGFKLGLENYYFKGGVEVRIDDEMLDGFGYTPLKYLHQLQNLYYALTGEDLQIDFSS